MPRRQVIRRLRHLHSAPRPPSRSCENIIADNSSHPTRCSNADSLILRSNRTKMAETLGVVGSIVGVAGFAGQLVKSSKFLYDFFKGIRDAPDDVRKLLEELEILGSIFGNIQNSFTGHDLELEMALKYCEQRINELIRLIKASDPSKVPKKRQRLWKQFKIALNNSEIAKHVGNLERAKSMVMQACANITRYP